jgi:type II secretory pathway component PulM
MPEVVSIAGFDTHYPDPDDHSIVTSKSGENYLTVAYDRMVPLLVEGIKELKDELDELKAKVAELRLEVTDLEQLRDRVAQLRIEVDALKV